MPRKFESEDVHLPPTLGSPCMEVLPGVFSRPLWNSFTETESDAVKNTGSCEGKKGRGGRTTMIE